MAGVDLSALRNGQESNSTLQQVWVCPEHNDLNGTRYPQGSRVKGVLLTMGGVENDTGFVLPSLASPRWAARERYGSEFLVACMVRSEPDIS